MNFREYIGSDESGKGETFGPLVVSSVYVDKNIEQKLRELGIKDSKLLSDSKIKEVAPLLKNVVVYNTISLSPEEYNNSYNSTHNQVKILTEMYEQNIVILGKKIECKNLIIDKFCNCLIPPFKFEEEYDLKFIPKAEKHLGVAAASILSRYEVVMWFESNNINKSHLQIKDILKTIPENELKKYAKMHFKSVKVED